MSRRRRTLTILLSVLVGVACVGLLAFAAPWGRGVRVETEVATATPGSFDDAFRAGLRALQSGQVAEAARAFESAAQIDPRSPEAQVNLGFAYLMANRTREAVDSFSRAVDLRPGQVNAYYGLAEALEQAGDLPAAIGAMRTFIHLTDDDDPFKRRAMAAVWEWEGASGSTPRPQPSSSSPPSQLTSLTAVAPLSAGSLQQARLTGVAGRIDGWGRYDGKLVVMNVWATWCAPCRAELASLQRLNQRLDSDLAVVIGVSIDKDAAFVREYLRDTGVTFENYIDPQQSITRDVLGVELVPYTLLIGPDGSIKDRITGFQDWDKVDAAGLIKDQAFRVAGGS